MDEDFERGSPEPVEPGPVPEWLSTLFGPAQLRRLELHAGDVVVLRVSEGIWPEDALGAFVRLVEQRFPGHHCVVLGPGIDIGVLGVHERKEGGDATC
jgi:hypothetical protein